jgi:hypothetical protein
MGRRKSPKRAWRSIDAAARILEAIRPATVRAVSGQKMFTEDIGRDNAGALGARYEPWRRSP